MVFEGAPRGIRLGRHGPLRAGGGVAQGHTAESFIFTMFYMGISIKVIF